MKAHESMVCWNPNTNEIDVFQWPDSRMLSEGYLCSWGACNRFFKRCSGDRLKIVLSAKAFDIALHSNVPLANVLDAFGKIDEFAAVFREWRELEESDL
jgi:hypothetical protein